MVECFHAIRCEQYCIILRSRNKSFLETLSSFCIFEKALFLDPRDSILETRSSNVSSIEARGSSLEVRVSSVNLLLSSTVHCIISKEQFDTCFLAKMLILDESQ